jgi:hypothetical protein
MPRPMAKRQSTASATSGLGLKSGPQTAQTLSKPSRGCREKQPAGRKASEVSGSKWAEPHERGIRMKLEIVNAELHRYFEAARDRLGIRLPKSVAA